MATENWRAISWAPAYEVSDHGRVRRVVPDKLGRCLGLLATPLNDKGYPNLNIHVAGRQCLCRVHRLVCEAFHGPMPEGKRLVRHLDGDKLNNHARNLVWGTHAENAIDAVRHTGGAKNLRGRKLVTYPIEVIRDIKFSGKSEPLLVREHGVSKALVWKIRTGLMHTQVEAA